MIGLQPLQESLVFLQSRGIEMRGLGVELGYGAVHACAHGRVVVHRPAHVQQGDVEPAQKPRRRVRRQGLEDHLDHRFQVGRAIVDAAALGVTRHRDHGMEHGFDQQPVLGDFAHDAVDQEGSVVLQDLQPFERQAAAVGARGRNQAHRRVDAVALFGEGPEIGETDGQVRQAEARQLARVVVVLDLVQEGRLGAAEAASAERAPKGGLHRLVFGARSGGGQGEGHRGGL